MGRHLVRDALRDAIEKLKQAEEIEDATRDALHLDQDIQGTTGTPDLALTIFKKIGESEVVVADVTVVGRTEDGDRLVNSNVAIELGYALRACTDERVLLVFNKHYGTYEDLPFDLRHKGGAVVFDLGPNVSRKEIALAQKLLSDDFVRKLKPFLQLPSRIKEPMSAKPVIEFRLQRRYALPNGGSDDVLQLQVSVENDGEQAASDFKLQLDVPSELIDETPPGGLSRVGPPGFSRFEIANDDAKIKYLYPGTKSPPLIPFNVAVRQHTKRQPEALKKSGHRHSLFWKHETQNAKRDNPRSGQCNEHLTMSSVIR